MSEEDIGAGGPNPFVPFVAALCLLAAAVIIAMTLANISQ